MINNITVYDPNDNIGDFSLLIGYPLDPNDPNSAVDPDKPGALHVNDGDLRYDGGASTVMGIYLAGDLATEDNVYLESVSGDIYIAGKLHEDGHPQELTYDLVVDGDIDGNIFIEELHGEILVPNGTVSGNITTGTVPFTPRTGGGVDIGGSYSAAISINDGFDGRIAIGGGLVNDGRIEVTGPNLGEIDLGGDLVAPAQIFSHQFVSQPNNSLPPSIRVRGSVDAGDLGPPPITIGTEDYHHLMGTIAIDGSIYGYAIQITGKFEYDWPNYPTMAAVTADYDGWDAADGWQLGACGTARHPFPPYDPFSFSGNVPGWRVWEITPCIGDMDNDGELDADDPNALVLAIGNEYDPNGFAYRDEEAYPGLYGSRMYHGDVNCDGYLDEDDLDALDWLIDAQCCMVECQFDACYADLNENGRVDLSDLAQLLGHYGTTSGATRDDGDLDDDGDVDLSDLAEMLGVYGGLCGCFGGGDGEGGGGGGGDSSAVTISVVPYDTGGYSGGGFNGEVDHFVFDLTIEVHDPNNDDWLVSGAALDAENDATFRLSSSATTPNKYATFVAAPWTTVPQSATATVAGAYDPPDPDEVFTTTELNLGWYDTDTDSDDGPAAVMRLVIDVSEVEGADVSEGFGSVYFSTSGPAEVGDIRVAQLSWGTATIQTLPDLKSLIGNFHVKGESP